MGRTAAKPQTETVGKTWNALPKEKDGDMMPEQETNWKKYVSKELLFVVCSSCCFVWSVEALDFIGQTGVD